MAVAVLLNQPSNASGMNLVQIFIPPNFYKKIDPKNFSLFVICLTRTVPYRNLKRHHFLDQHIATHTGVGKHISVGWYGP